MKKKLYRVGFYLEVEFEGRDATDAMHRAEASLDLVAQARGRQSLPREGVATSFRVLTVHEIRK